MRLVLIAAVALAASGSAAFAEQPAAAAAEARPVVVCDPSADASGAWVRGCASAKAERVSRQVFVCDHSAATRRSWMREYGEMTFVTADELASAEAANEGWAKPRCMTSAEMRRFTRDRPEAATVARAMDTANGL